MARQVTSKNLRKLIGELTEGAHEDPNLGFRLELEGTFASDHEGRLSIGIDAAGVAGKLGLPVGVESKMERKRDLDGAGTFRITVWRDPK